MDLLINWVRGIIGCLLMMSFLLHAAPGKTFRPYLRLFAGIVLILTVLAPLMEPAGFSGIFQTMAEESVFEDQAPAWESRLTEGENWTKQQIIQKAQEMSKEEEESAKTETEDEKELFGGSSPTEKTDKQEEVQIKVEAEVDEIMPVVISGED